jgi:phosphatidylglycerol:prolipoprotein diacylglycerol transferase
MHTLLRSFLGLIARLPWWALYVVSDLLFFIMLWFTARPRPTWAAGGVFCTGYGCLRFIAEFFREPDAHIGFQAFGWLTRGQLLCVPMIGLGLFLLWWAYSRPDKTARGLR